MPVRQATQEEMDAFQRRVVAASQSHINRASLPIFSFVNETYYQLGSGVLFEIADSCFLVTAAHIVDRFLYHDEHCYLPSSPEFGTPVPINGVQVMQTPTPKGFDDRDENMREFDPLDTGVVKLSDAMVAALRPYYRFNRLNELDGSTPLPDGVHMVCGFPCEATRRGENRICAQAYNGITELTEPSEGAFVTPYSIFFKHKSISTDEQGAACYSPNPQGMSGGCIWRLAEYAKPNDLWTISDVRLVGINNWCHWEHHMQGTSIRLAMEMIYYRWPSLRRPMDLAFPDWRIEGAIFNPVALPTL